MPECFFNKFVVRVGVAGLAGLLLKRDPSEACNVIKKEPLAPVFSREFYEIFKKNFFTEHLWMTASTY